jgi:hypothetical protein
VHALFLHGLGERRRVAVDERQRDLGVTAMELADRIGREAMARRGSREPDGERAGATRGDTRGPQGRGIGRGE